MKRRRLIVTLGLAGWLAGWPAPFVGTHGRARTLALCWKKTSNNNVAPPPPARSRTHGQNRRFAIYMKTIAALRFHVGRFKELHRKLAHLAVKKKHSDRATVWPGVRCNATNSAFVSVYIAAHRGSAPLLAHRVWAEA